jgi:hypothetical protein
MGSGGNAVTLGASTRPKPLKVSSTSAFARHAEAPPAGDGESVTTGSTETGR